MLRRCLRHRGPGGLYRQVDHIHVHIGPRLQVMPAVILDYIRLFEAYEMAAHAGLSSLSDGSLKQCRGAAQCGASVGSVLARVFPWATGDQTYQAWFSDLSSRFTGASLHATTRMPCVRAQASKPLCISVLCRVIRASYHKNLHISGVHKDCRRMSLQDCFVGLMPSYPSLIHAQAQAGLFCSRSAQVCCQLVCCLGPGQATTLSNTQQQNNLHANDRQVDT